MIARNNSVNGKIPVKGILKRFNQLKRFNYKYLPIALPRSLGTDLHEYFNRKTGRTGHLFDNRYSRVAVESDTQAVQLIDYIHLNPVKGAIDSLEAYRWSSYKAYQLGYDPFDICDAAPMLDIVGGSRRYCEHLKEVAGRIWSVEVLPRRRIHDEDALSVAREVLPSIDPALLKALPRPERDACLLRLRRAHLTVKQISRITGIGATSVTKATAGWNEAA